MVTNPTNLYPQADFKSRDVVLTFHVGLAMRVMTRDHVPMPKAQELFVAVWRRWEQAAEALAGAEEAEHFQAAGTHLQECLISFAHAIQTDELVPEGNERPSPATSWPGLACSRTRSRRRRATYGCCCTTRTRRVWMPRLGFRPWRTFCRVSPPAA